MEVQRLSNVVPFPIPHYAIRDTKVQGYTIPKVSSQICSIRNKEKNILD